LKEPVHRDLRPPDLQHLDTSAEGHIGGYEPGSYRVHPHPGVGPRTLDRWATPAFETL
jgi:hypothetical protein